MKEGPSVPDNPWGGEWDCVAGGQVIGGEHRAGGWGWALG